MPDELAAYLRRQRDFHLAEITRINEELDRLHWKRWWQEHDPAVYAQLYPEPQTAAAV